MENLAPCRQTKQTAEQLGFLQSLKEAQDSLQSGLSYSKILWGWQQYKLNQQSVFCPKCFWCLGNMFGISPQLSGADILHVDINSAISRQHWDLSMYIKPFWSQQELCLYLKCNFGPCASLVLLPFLSSLLWREGRGKSQACQMQPTSPPLFHSVVNEVISLKIWIWKRLWNHFTVSRIPPGR